MREVIGSDITYALDIAILGCVGALVMESIGIHRLAVNAQKGESLMTSDTSKMLSLAEIIDAGGRAFMLIPVYDWMIPMIDEAAAEARKGTEFPDNVFN